MLNDPMAFISNLGFPIAVSVYLLVRFEKKLETLELAIKKLTDVLSSKGWPYGTNRERPRIAPSKIAT